MEDLLTIRCRNCSAPVGYDIVRETYRCTKCGELSGVREIVAHSPRWRQLNCRDRRPIPTEQALYYCPGCGAELLFPAGEESLACEFCGNALIRREFEESEDFPQLIIPFVLTREEAQQRLDAWIQSHRKQPEAAWLQGKQVKACYLPYKLIRGPVTGRVTRHQTFREYHCRGYLEGTLVNTSRQLDNSVLDRAEPFDLRGLRPFEHSFIAGQALKLSDLSPAKTKRRALKEGAEAFRPQAARTLQTKSIRVNLQSEDLMEIPLVLPFYLIQDGDRLAVVNGQTGRVAVSAARVSPPEKIWMLEPILLTAFLTLLLGPMGRFQPLYLGLIALVLGIILFSVYGKDRYRLTRKIISFSRSSAAKRKDKQLIFKEGENLIRNPLSNTPVFSETIDGHDTQVNLKFITFGRILEMVLRMLTFFFLPVLLALPFSLILERTMHPGHAMAWYCIAAFIDLMYFSLGIRQGLYNRPLIYKKTAEGKQKLITPRKQRSLGILTLMGFTGIRLKEKMKDPDNPKRVKFIIAMSTFVLAGSILAVLL